LPRFRFVVPVLPTRANSPNGRLGWRAKARATRQMREDWGRAIAAARGTQGVWNDPLFDGPVSMRATFHWPKGRNLADAANLVAAIKPGIDAFEDTGIVLNDAQIAAPEIAQERTAGDGYVEVELVG
jgi:Holliday junction resolvase RusA-like endonuclease